MRRAVGLAVMAAALWVAGCSARTDGVATVEYAQSRELVDGTGQHYVVSVSVPPGSPPAQGWPVIYALDGGITFATLADAVRVQSQRPEVTGVQPTVVVAIGYPREQGIDPPRRQWDLTPPVPGVAAKDSGGADRFLDFIEHTVKPALEAEVLIDRGRQTLFGHSYGGLFALHVLFTRPASFQTYVAASPSIWWRDRFILTEAARAPWSRGEGPRPAVLLTAGEYEQALPGADAETAARFARRRQVDAAVELAGTLAAAGLAADVVVFPAENHGSVLPAALSRAARFASTGKAR